MGLQVAAWPFAQFDTSKYIFNIICWQIVQLVLPTLHPVVHDRLQRRTYHCDEYECERLVQSSSTGVSVSCLNAPMIWSVECRQTPSYAAHNLRHAFVISKGYACIVILRKCKLKLCVFDATLLHHLKLAALCICRTVPITHCGFCLSVRSGAVVKPCAFSV